MLFLAVNFMRECLCVCVHACEMLSLVPGEDSTIEVQLQVIYTFSYLANSWN